MVIARLAPASLLVALLGCSSSDGGPNANPTPQTQALSFRMEYATPPRTEGHFCQYVKLPKDASGEILVNGRTHAWAKGTHHFALYRTTLSAVPAGFELGKNFDCFSGDNMASATSSIVLEQAITNDIDFPQGTALPFKSEEILMAQVHTVNPTDKPQTSSLDWSLKLADRAQVKERMGLIQFYDPFIFVPAKGSGTASMRCKVPRDMTIVEATTHQHPRGVSVETFVEPASGAPSSTPLVSSASWEHPTVWKGNVSVKAGSFIRTVCKYENGGDKNVIQGQDKDNNEMCMFVAYYYPAIPREPGQGFGPADLFENCVPTSVPGGVGDRHGTGTKSCGDTTTCVRACAPGDAPKPLPGRIDVGECFQKCIVESCPSASTPFNAQSLCISTQCKAECGGTGEGCASCVITKCAKEFEACQAHKCE